MKTLANQTLLYDEDCPLCRVYTSGFIKAGMLDKNGKKSYCQLSAEEQNFIDVKRASNEIALVDNENKTVIYGIDSLLKVIGFSIPWVEKVGNLKPIKFFLKKLYSFISYNRKVIIPSKINKELKLQCIPDFNFKYRFLYILFAVLVSGFILNKVYFHFSYSKIIGFLLMLLFMQSILISTLSKKTIVLYLGNFMTSLLIGSLLIMPILVVNEISIVSHILSKNYSYVILVLTLIDIIRRIKIIKFNLS